MEKIYVKKYIEFCLDNNFKITEKCKNNFRGMIKSEKYKTSEFLLKVVKNCNLESNKKLPLLNRTEGGLGGDSNTENKQLRFFENYNIKNMKSIRIILYNSYNEKEIWTNEEIYDFTASFVEILNLELKFNQRELIVGRLCNEVYYDY
jgi:hypothetical protein